MRHLMLKLMLMLMPNEDVMLAHKHKLMRMAIHILRRAYAHTRIRAGTSEYAPYLITPHASAHVYA